MIENSIDAFYREVASRRGTGRTTALMEAVEACQGTLVVHNKAFAQQLREGGHLHVTALGPIPGGISYIRGYRGPILVDHYLVDHHIFLLVETVRQLRSTVKLYDEIIRDRNREIDRQIGMIRDLNCYLDEFREAVKWKSLTETAPMYPGFYEVRPDPGDATHPYVFLDAERINAGALDKWWGESAQWRRVFSLGPDNKIQYHV